MISMNRMNRVIHLAILGVLGSVSLCPCQTSDELHLITSPADESTAIRFFFYSEISYHPPLIYRVVAPQDPRLNTAPLLLSVGRIAYISESEIQRLQDGLAGLGLSWKKSQQVEIFSDAFPKFPLYLYEVAIASSRGTVVSSFDPAKVCEDLARLDSTFTTPRALWEFQEFRVQYHCKVPGFDVQTYPDHWPGSK